MPASAHRRRCRRLPTALAGERILGQNVRRCVLNFTQKSSVLCILVVSNQSRNWTTKDTAEVHSSVVNSKILVMYRLSGHPQDPARRDTGCAAFARACLLLSSMAARRLCSRAMAEAEQAVLRGSGARSTCSVRSTRCDATLRRRSVTSRAATEAAPDHQRYPDELKRPSSREEIPWQ